ncbi:MAG TPA: amidohydrolase family protein [Leptolyngbyaceae cyanobacterium]
MKKIDAYTHFCPLAFIDFLESSTEKQPHVFRKLFSATPTLTNPDLRLRLMDKNGIDMHVLVPLPWIEATPTIYTNPILAAPAAKLCNDGLYQIVSTHPDRFLGVAILPTTNSEILMAEFERAINELGFVGAVIFIGPTAVRGDDQIYEPLYQRAAELGVPLWLHPCRPGNYPDYIDENKSEYLLWQTLGWLMDTSSVMVRLVFSGVFQRYPQIKFITHHHGALIPLFAKRMQESYTYFECNSDVKLNANISQPYINHFKNFYCDTATLGYEPLLLEMAYNFFGVDHILFGSDTPMDTKAGDILTPETDRSIANLNITEAEREKIYGLNFINLIKRNN